jgi:hypothetical protein
MSSKAESACDRSGERPIILGRWSIYIDIEGFSAGWEKDNGALWSLGELMRAIFRVCRNCPFGGNACRCPSFRSFRAALSSMPRDFSRVSKAALCLPRSRSHRLGPLKFPL